MSNTEDVDAEGATDDRPTFRGCVICYSAEWAAHAIKRGYRAVST